MSVSRLEKFLYAIYALDQSDLPTPLSRLEMLLLYYLITKGKISDDDLSSIVGYSKIGETTTRDFSNYIPLWEPLSRSEKYLMAMLDRYDISNLPAPMSRGEKLLYKLAIGETDLSDVTGYLSRYEELLKYLIENGGVLEKEDFNAIAKNGDILVTKNGDNLIYRGAMILEKEVFNVISKNGDILVTKNDDNLIYRGAMM